jgi:hypothetical protein
MAKADGSRVVVSLASAALRYAQRGWAVFPLVPKGKRPRLPTREDGKAGCWDGTADTATVEAWWDRWPDSNIGIHCGPGSGLFVLDVDAEAPEGGVSGPDALVALEALHGALPATLTATTGGGGEHRYFRMPVGRVLRNRAGMKLPSGEKAALDVRAEGGYVVLPPSVHPSGREYRWLGSVREPAEAPGWLLDFIDPPREVRATPEVYRQPAGDHVRRYGEKALQAACNIIAGATESERHDTIYREAAASGGLGGRAAELDGSLAAGGCAGAVRDGGGGHRGAGVRGKPRRGRRFR